MPSIGQSIIQGLATGFQGDQLATDLAQQKLQLQAGQRKLKAEEYQTSADKVWSKAIMDVLAGQQTAAAPPIAPQPGQASVPMTQGTAGVPAAAGGGTPAAPGLGGPRPPAPAQPAGGTPTDATLQTLGQTAVPQAQLPPVADPLNAASILAKIKADNPNLDDGVLSSVVNDHLMPLLSDQQKNSYKQFTQQLDLMKLGAGEQDKLNTLYFRYQQLQEQMANAGENRAMRLQIAQMIDSTKQQMMAILTPYREAQTKELQARAAKEAAAAGPTSKLPPKMKARLDTLTKRQGWLTSEINNANMAGQDDRVKTLEAQVKPLQDEIDGILNQADQLDAQGAPATPDAGTAVGTVKQFKLPDGTPVTVRKTKVGPDDDQSTWAPVGGG